MSERAGRGQFVFFGILFFIFSGLIIFATISSGGFPAGHDVMMLAMSVMAFCNAYLYPQFKKNDERTKKIRERGMFFSYFFIMGYVLILGSLFYFEVIQMSAYQAISLLGAMIIATVFLSFVVLSRRY